MAASKPTAPAKSNPHLPGRWFLADRATRSIAPGFTITPAEAEKLTTSVAAPTTTAPAATTPKP